MLVKTEQLASHLKKQLPALVWISGDETLLVQETMDNVRNIAKEQGFTEREVHDVSAQFNWNILLESASSLSLFADKKLIDLRLHSPKLDNEESDLLASGQRLTPSEEENFLSLSRALEDIQASNVPCIGDGNLDGVIDELDIDQLDYWQALSGLSSWYDFDLNGLTNDEDLAFITADSLPRDCP